MHGYILGSIACRTDEKAITRLRWCAIIGERDRQPSEVERCTSCIVLISSHSGTGRSINNVKGGWRTTLGKPEVVIIECKLGWIKDTDNLQCPTSCIRGQSLSSGLSRCKEAYASRPV